MSSKKNESAKFKAVFFDVDGVLIDTTEFIYQAFEYTLAKHKLSPKTREEITVVAGRHIKEMYAHLAPLYDFDKLMVTHTEFYRQNLHLIESYSGVKETLKKLKEEGIKIAALSNRFAALSETLKHSGLLSYIDLIISGNDVANPKPHPEQIFKALDYFGLKAKDAVIVGDRPSDILAGKNAKVKTIAVSHGFSEEEIEEYKPDYVVNDLPDILPIFQK